MNREKLEKILEDFRKIKNDQGIPGQLWIVETFEDILEAILEENCHHKRYPYNSGKRDYCCKCGKHLLEYKPLTKVPKLGTVPAGNAWTITLDNRITV